MLTPDAVLEYIKTNLGLPFNPMEYTDQQILNQVRITTIREFSRYLPDEHKYNFDLSTCQTELENEFRIIDPDGLPILSIQNVYFEQGGLIVMGFPVIALFGPDEHALEQYILDTERAGTSNKYGMFNYYYEFRPPNLLRIMPKPPIKPTLIEYERMHKSDFSTIPAQYETTFLQMAFADVALWLARTRSIFRTFNTPFGDIELNPDDLKTEAQEIKSRILEELQNVNPSVIVDSG